MRNGQFNGRSITFTANNLVDSAIFVFRSLKEIDLLFPRRNINFHKRHGCAFGLRERIKITGKDLGAMLKKPLDGCETDTGRSTY